MSDIETREEDREELAEFRRIKAAYLVELSARGNKMHPKQYHGHAHSIDGIWDRDNGIIAGKECVACMLHRAATEPSTVELPKCDHCSASCGTDCDGSSHYTAEVKP